MSAEQLKDQEELEDMTKGGVGLCSWAAAR